MVGLLLCRGGSHSLTLGLLVLHDSETLAWHENGISSKIKMMRGMEKRGGLEREQRLTDTSGDEEEDEDEAMLMLISLSLLLWTREIEGVYV